MDQRSKALVLLRQIGSRHAHETSTRTHARDNTHTAHTRRRRARTLVTTRTRRARTRVVNATHARESTHMTVTHAHETSTRTHARENTPTARTHAHETSMQSTFVNTRARRPPANASTHALVRVVVKGERCRYSMTATLE